MNSVNENNDILWHYCSMQTFFNIISSKSIRLNDIYKSNDYLEKVGFQKLLKQTVINKYFTKQVTVPNKYRDFLLCNFVNDQNENLSNYCFCLTDKEDSQLHWGYYANNGTGVAIGFKKSAFSFNESDNIELIKINYNKDDIVKNIEKKLDDLFLIFKENPKASELDSNVFTCLNEIYSLGKTFKSETFGDESEYRLLLPGEEREGTFNYLHKTVKSVDNSITYKLLPIDYQCVNDSIKSFYTLSFEKYFEMYNMNSDFFIKKIVLGPKCKENTTEIKQFISNQLMLSRTNYDKCVNKSIAISKLLKECSHDDSNIGENTNDIQFELSTNNFELNIEKSKLSLR